MNFKQLADKSYRDPYWRASLHVLFWLFIFGSNYYFSSISFGSLKHEQTNYLLAAKSTITLVIFYYSLMYYVWPKLLYKRKFIAGILSVILLLLLYTWMETIGDKVLLNGCEECKQQLLKNNPNYYNYMQLPVPTIMLTRIASLGIIYQLLILLSLPVAIRLARVYFRQTIQQLQLSRDNLQLEFNFLKAQVNPHFLFNTLNNIYSLVVHDKKKAAGDMIVRLSDFMRYALYDCNEEKISLDKEISVMKDYVELEKLRLNQTDIQFTYQADSDNYRVPPLLLMPALENAFKYSADHVQDSYIAIDIRVAGNRMEVEMKNSVDPAKTLQPGGIGLTNMQKRLQHYYRGAYVYSVDKNDRDYSMKLTCQL